MRGRSTRSVGSAEASSVLCCSDSILSGELYVHVKERRKVEIAEFK